MANRQKIKHHDNTPLDFTSNIGFINHITDITAIRLPRLKASKQTWKRFFKLYPNIINDYNNLSGGVLTQKYMRNSLQNRKNYKMKNIDIIKESVKDFFTAKEYDDMKFVVYIMCGIPGSGKSTWIKENLDANIPIISRDIIRYDLGYIKNEDDKVVLSKQQEKKVTALENGLIEGYCQAKTSFVIDDTNIGKYRKELVDRLHSFNAYVIGVNMLTPLDICISRREGQISHNAMKNIYSRYKPIEIDEVDEVRNISENDIKIIKNKNL